MVTQPGGVRSKLRLLVEAGERRGHAHSWSGGKGVTNSSTCRRRVAADGGFPKES